MSVCESAWCPFTHNIERQQNIETMFSAMPHMPCLTHFYRGLSSLFHCSLPWKRCLRLMRGIGLYKHRGQFVVTLVANITRWTDWRHIGNQWQPKRGYYDDIMLLATSWNKNGLEHLVTTGKINGIMWKRRQREKQLDSIKTWMKKGTPTEGLGLHYVRDIDTWRTSRLET